MIIQPKNDLVVTTGYSVPTKVLSKEKHYYVFAIEKRNSKVAYYVLDDHNSELPLKYSSDLFNTTDSSLPSDWVTHHSGWWHFKKEFVSFPEWANDLGKEGYTGYYERLVDSGPGDPERVILEKYVNKAKEETSYSKIS